MTKTAREIKRKLDARGILIGLVRKYGGTYQSYLITEALTSLLSLLEEKLKIDIICNGITPDLVEQNFPKGKCKERGQAIVLHAQMLIAIQEIINAEVKTILRETLTTKGEQ